MAETVYRQEGERARKRQRKREKDREAVTCGNSIASVTAPLSPADPELARDRLLPTGILLDWATESPLSA